MLVHNRLHCYIMMYVYIMMSLVGISEESSQMSPLTLRKFINELINFPSP